MPYRPPTHRPQGWKPAPNKRPQVQDDYYGTAAWKALRKACLQRDRYQCAAPGCETLKRGHGGRLIAHHLVDRRKGGPDTLENLSTRCPTCDNQGHADKGSTGR